MLSGLILATLALIGTLSFNFTYAISGTQTAYLGLYKGIVEKNVFVVGENDQYAATPYFDIAGLDADLEDYFLLNLRPYCRAYSYEVKGKSRNENGYIDALRITLDVQLTLTYGRQYLAIFVLERKD